jgi:hypothetical protein
MENIEYNGRTFAMYTELDVRRMMNIKSECFKSWIRKKWIPQSPIFRRTKVRLKSKQYDENKKVIVDKSGKPILKQVEGKRRYYSEEMILIVYNWYNAVKGQNQKNIRPSNSDINLLHTHFLAAAKTWIENANSKEKKELIITTTAKELFTKAMQSIVNPFKTKEEFKDHLFKEFFASIEEIFNGKDRKS